MIASFRGNYAFLSNFYAHDITFEGITYPTNEHAFQAAKTLNTNERLAIATCLTPAGAKGRGKRGNLRPNWEGFHRYETMETLIRIKFSDPDLMQSLLDTGDQMLYEGNSWKDKTWGVDDVSMRGHNLLGWMLMREREVRRG